MQASTHQQVKSQYIIRRIHDVQKKNEESYIICILSKAWLRSGLPSRLYFRQYLTSQTKVWPCLPLTRIPSQVMLNFFVERQPTVRMKQHSIDVDLPTSKLVSPNKTFLLCLVPVLQVWPCINSHWRPYQAGLSAFVQDQNPASLFQDSILGCT